MDYKQSKTMIKTKQWLRLVAVAVMGVIGVVLVLHDLDTRATGLSWGLSLTLRLAGVAQIWGTVKVWIYLWNQGELPDWLKEE